MSTIESQTTTTFGLSTNSRSVHDTFDGGRYHLVLGFSEDTMARIEKLALGLGHGDQGKVIDQALGLLNLAYDSAQEGKRLWIVDDQGQPDLEIEGLTG